MATYNGARYITPQICSIVEQLESCDELIVVDDCSTDDTVSIVRSHADHKIKLFPQTRNYGHVRTFAKALSLARNPIILLADQDDVWPAGRVTLLASALLASDCCLVTSNFTLINERGECLGDPVQALSGDSSRNHVYNIAGIFLGRRPYFGCAMAVKAELLGLALPIPRFVESHDLWIALIANVLRKNLHDERVTIMRRVHSKNLTPMHRRGIYKILKSRAILLLSTFYIVARLLNRKIRRVKHESS